MFERNILKPQNLFFIALLIAVFTFLLKENFLLFHTTIEILTTFISFAVFIFAWNTRSEQTNGILLFWGISYLFIGIMDLTHALTYEGMNIFPDLTGNTPAQFWVSARYLESLIILVAFLFVKRTFKPEVVICSLGIITTILILMIFNTGIFPDCYIDGEGLTSFKIVSEFLISILLIISIVLLIKNRIHFDPSIHIMLLISLIFNVIAEVLFSSYVTVTDATNLLGHIFKLFSFFLVYEAIIHKGLVSPMKLLFYNLKKNEAVLEENTLYLDQLVVDKTEELSETVAELQKQDQMLNHILSVANMAHFTVEHEHGLFERSILMDELLGVTSREFYFAKEYFSQVIHESEKQKLKAFLSKLSSSTSEFKTVLKCVHEETGRDVYLSVNCSTWEDNGFSKTIGLVQDISDVKNQELELQELLKRVQESELLFRRLFESSPDAIAIIDESGEFFNINRPNLCGNTFCEVGNSMYDLLTEESIPEYHKAVQTVLSTGSTACFEPSIVSADGTPTYWFNRISLLSKDDKHSRLIINFTDVTEKRIKAELFEKQSYILDQIFAHTLDSIVLMDSDYNFIRVSQTYADACQQPIEHFAGKNHFELYPSPLKEEFDEVKAKKTTYMRLERPFEFPDHPEWGVTYWNLGLIPILDNNGEIEFFLFTLKDVSTEVNSRVKIEKSEKLYRSITENATEQIIQFDISGIITFMNNSAVNLFGFGSSGNRHISELFSENDELKVLNSITNEESLSESFSVEIGNISKEMICNIVPMFESENVIGGTCIATDITEQNELEKKLRLSQKMSALGHLSGGIAHDFNNILSAINGNAELALLDIANDSWESVAKNFRNILSAGERAKKLVMQILKFSRKNEVSLRPLNISAVVLETVEMLRATIPSSIEITDDIKFEGYRIIGDATQVHEIIMNISTNAVHSMEEGGTISILLYEKEKVREEYGVLGAISEGKYIICEIIDTGCGIPADAISDVFSPFYTTKEEGKGTGLGLSVVYGILQSHNANFQIDSTCGVGTTFRIFFNKWDEKYDEVKQESNLSFPQGCEKILLIDDESMILSVNSKFLKSLGYIVETASDGLEALELFELKPDYYDLILTDLTMPNLTGLELIQAIRGQNSLIPLVLCSGLSSQVTQEMMNDNQINKLLSKPTSFSALALGIRSAMDEPLQQNISRELSR